MLQVVRNALPSPAPGIPGRFARVPMPESILRGESIGPFYPPTELPNGYRFEGEDPVQREKPKPPQRVQTVK